MIKKIYQNYFAKDKFLRHYTQHILTAAVVGIIFLSKLEILNWKTFLIFISINLLTDLDGITFLFVNEKNDDLAGRIIGHSKRFEFRKAFQIAAKEHKKYVGLYLHNIFGLITVVVLLFIFTALHKDMLSTVTGAILTHFLFDIFDDYYQLGHIKNWLWPIKYITGRNS